MKFKAIFLSSFCLYIRIALSFEFDQNHFCHGHGSIEYTRNFTCKALTQLVSVPSLHGNPFHAFHDTAWAVGYYLLNCVGDPRETFLWIKADPLTNVTFCEIEPAVYNKSRHPKWGICLLRNVAIEIGIPHEHILLSENEPKYCFRRSTRVKGNFRNLRYTWSPTKHSLFRKLWGDRPLVPWEFRRDALRKIARSVLAQNTLSVYSIRNRIQVLAYGRSDIRRRRWRNINESLDLIRSNSLYQVTYLPEMPRAFAAQVDIFRRADIIITPHGAALANSIFMKPGSAIIEVHKCCRQEVRLKPKEPRMWTAWHGKEYDLNITYVQCHRPHQILSIPELKAMEPKENSEDRWCSLPEFDVSPEEVYRSVLETGIKVRKIQLNKKAKFKLLSNVNIANVIFYVELVLLILITIQLTKPSTSRIKKSKQSFKAKGRPRRFIDWFIL